jgi:hypothetical protein
MLKRDEIPIPNPCTRDYGAMVSTHRAARFCDACAKEVHDLTRMSEHEARDLLRSRRGDVCVRYASDRDGFVLFHRDLVRQRRSPALIAAALAAPIAV